MSESPRPFWREPMVWLVAGLPLASIVAGITLVVISVRSGGADSVTDPVRRVAQIQTTDLGPDSAASQRRLSAVVRVEDGVVEVFPVTGDFDRRAPLELAFLHPAQAQADRRLRLLPSATGWRVQAELDATHDWKLQLTPADGTWRLHGRLPRQQHATRLAPSLAP